MNKLAITLTLHWAAIWVVMAFKTLKSIDDNVAFHAVEDICVLTYVRTTLTFIQWPW